MGFNCGIVGLPNVGKSTLFNALTATASAEAANYPFCTIEPNTGRVSVPDERLDTLAKLAKSVKTIPAQLEFVDIAGLVAGASKGEGLGNQFLGHIREVDAIVHVLRCFEDDDITHVSGRVDPVADADVVETELMLADLESLEKRIDGLVKKAKGNDKEAMATLPVAEKVAAALRDGVPARALELSADEKPIFAGLLPHQKIGKITLEESLELFKLPCYLGDFENVKVESNTGRFGPYVRHNNIFVSGILF